MSDGAGDDAKFVFSFLDLHLEDPPDEVERGAISSAEPSPSGSSSASVDPFEETWAPKSRLPHRLSRPPHLALASKPLTPSSNARAIDSNAICGAPRFADQLPELSPTIWSSLPNDGPSRAAHPAGRPRSSSRRGQSGALASYADPNANNRVLHMGDLDLFMQDVGYITHCVRLMGWDTCPSESGETHFKVDVKLGKGPANAMSGYCFLTFPTPADAAAAMHLFTTCQQRTLMPASSRCFKLNWATGVPGAPAVFHKEYSIFVGDLPQQTTESELLELFAQYFESCTAAKLMHDAATGLSKGYGFVRFSEESDSLRAIALGKEQGLLLRGRPIRTSEATVAKASTTKRGGRSRSNPANPACPTSPTRTSLVSPLWPAYGASYAASASPPRQRSATLANEPSAASASSSHCLFVGNLAPATSEDALASLFAPFGPMLYCKIPPNRGCGFVQYVRQADAAQALVQLQGFHVHGSRIRLSWTGSAPSGPPPQLSPPPREVSFQPNPLLRQVPSVPLRAPVATFHSPWAYTPVPASAPPGSSFFVHLPERYSAHSPADFRLAG